MGNQCGKVLHNRYFDRPNLFIGKLIDGYGGELDHNLGDTYVVIVAFNYEPTTGYDPSYSGLGQLSCIPDARRFEELCDACEVKRIERYYDDADYPSDGFPAKDKIVKQIRYYASICRPHDTFIFFFAGHGTQGDDDDGDESDGKDEEMCFVDQEGNYTPLVDDYMAEILQEFDVDTRVLIVTDCCQSHTVCDLNKRELEDHNIAHIAAVKDHQFAQDLGDGGAFTSSLVETVEHLFEDDDPEMSLKEVFNTCFQRYSHQFRGQDFAYECTERVDPDEFPWPLNPPEGWQIDTALDRR